MSFLGVQDGRTSFIFFVLAHRFDAAAALWWLKVCFLMFSVLASCLCPGSFPCLLLFLLVMPLFQKSHLLLFFLKVKPTSAFSPSHQNVLCQSSPCFAFLCVCVWTWVWSVTGTAGSAEVLLAIRKVTHSKKQTYRENSNGRVLKLRERHRTATVRSAPFRPAFCSVCSSTRREEEEEEEEGERSRWAWLSLHGLISLFLCTQLWRSLWWRAGRRPGGVRSPCCATPATDPWKIKHRGGVSAGKRWDTGKDYTITGTQVTSCLLLFIFVTSCVVAPQQGQNTSLRLCKISGRRSSSLKRWHSKNSVGPCLSGDTCRSGHTLVYWFNLLILNSSLYQWL